MKVAVIGGGYAGLAAAVELAAKDGISVTVFEAAGKLGGRARRVDYRDTILDNGQHILLGAYRETLRLMSKVGADPDTLLLRIPLQLVIPGKFSLQSTALPAPLHLAFGLLMARGLTWSERLSAVRFMSTLQRQRFLLESDTSVSMMLATLGQTTNLISYLWEPLCIGALNTPIKTASAQVFLNVLRDSLAGSRRDSDMLLPLTNLTELFPERAADFIQRHGGTVMRSRTVLAIKNEASGFSLETSEGVDRFDKVVCAVAPQRMAALTANLPELADVRTQVTHFSYQPIYNIFLQYPATTRLPRPMIGLHGGLTQWVFDRSQINHEAGLLCAVISAEGSHQALDHDQLAVKIHDELRASLNNLPPPFWHKVIAEKRATFACTRGLQRPEQSTLLPNFYLVGDYTASDYPATLESAVRSGVKAANLILNSCKYKTNHS